MKTEHDLFNLKERPTKYFKLYRQNIARKEQLIIKQA
jgi:hypothetical protein